MEAVDVPSDRVSDKLTETEGSDSNSERSVGLWDSLAEPVEVASVRVIELLTEPDEEGLPDLETVFAPSTLTDFEDDPETDLEAVDFHVVCVPEASNANEPVDDFDMVVDPVEVRAISVTDVFTDFE